MEKRISALRDADVLKDYDSLEQIFTHIAASKDSLWDLGYIQHQEACSNIKKQIMFFFNLKEHVVEEFEDFAKSFGLRMVGDLVFYSWLGCCCNNPTRIRYVKPSDWKPLWLQQLFEQPEQPERPVLGTDYRSLRLVADKVLVNKVKWWCKEPFQDGEYWYAPYQVCDAFLSSLVGNAGCSSPDDIGYFRRRKTEV